MLVLFLNSKAGFGKQDKGGNLVLLTSFSKGVCWSSGAEGCVPAVFVGYAEWQRVGFQGGCNKNNIHVKQEKCFCLSGLGKTTVGNGKNHNGRSARVPAEWFAPVRSGRR